MYERLGGATANVAAKAIEEPESASLIRDLLTAQEQLLSELHDAMTRLEKRLDTVLTPASPERVPDAKISSTGGSLINTRLVILNEGFSHNIQRGDG